MLPLDLRDTSAVCALYSYVIISNDSITYIHIHVYITYYVVEYPIHKLDIYPQPATLPQKYPILLRTSNNTS